MEVLEWKKGNLSPWQKYTNEWQNTLTYSESAAGPHLALPWVC